MLSKSRSRHIDRNFASSKQMSAYWTTYQHSSSCRFLLRWSSLTFVLVSQPVLTTNTYVVAWPQGDQFLGGVVRRAPPQFKKPPPPRGGDEKMMNCFLLHSSRHPAHLKAPRSCSWDLVTERETSRGPPAGGPSLSDERGF